MCFGGKEIFVMWGGRGMAASVYKSRISAITKGSETGWRVKGSKKK